MANREHLELLSKGVTAWNERYYADPSFAPDLSDTDLSGYNLERYIIREANLNNANLSGVNLQYSDLVWTSLKGTNLRKASLRRAVFGEADLSGADLSGADLSFTTFNAAILEGVNLDEAICQETYFIDVDLSHVQNLASCDHWAWSTIDHRTLSRSNDLPLEFLRGCGLPDLMIENVGALKGDPIQFYSCFISYSSKDNAFARRLHADLQNNGVRCWFAPEHMKIGDKIRPAIHDAIRLYDKLLLILSKDSVHSQWVEDEVERALEKERRDGSTVLFPIRLDDSVMEIDRGWPVTLRNSRHIGDFRHWKDHESYQAAFDRLLRDLKATG